MTTPNFPQVAADIRDEFDAEARNRKAIEVAAASASHRVDPQINLAANLIRQQHIGVYEALVLLYAIKQKVHGDEHFKSEIEWLCLAITDEVIDIAKAGVRPYPE